MMASRYAPQIFWVLATALAYTLLALAVAEKKQIGYSQGNKKRLWQVVGFPKRIHTHDALDWIDSAQHGFKNIHHSFVPQDGLLKHCQEVLMGETGC